MAEKKIVISLSAELHKKLFDHCERDLNACPYHFARKAILEKLEREEPRVTVS